LQECKKEGNGQVYRDRHAVGESRNLENAVEGPGSMNGPKTFARLLPLLLRVKYVLAFCTSGG
jgi:hypothetical protein